jgi:hypothetical protein
MDLFEPVEEMRGLCPFGETYASDLWVAYHGSTDASERLIESDGFTRPDEIHHSQEAIALVLRTFDELSWAGRRLGGFGALSTYSDPDRRRSTDGHDQLVFFAATSRRALLYATPDFAGVRRVAPFAIASTTWSNT